MGGGQFNRHVVDERINHSELKVRVAVVIDVVQLRPALANIQLLSIIVQC